MFAAKNGFVQVVIDFLDSEKCTDALINARDIYGKTAFQLATENNHPEVVQAFVDRNKTTPMPFFAIILFLML